VLGSFPHISKGIEVVYDVKAQPGQRVTSFTFNGEPLDLEREYTITTTIYLLNGGDGCAAFKNHTPIPHEKEGTAIGQCVIDYILKHRIIGAKKEGRIHTVKVLKKRNKESEF
jgi:5'-nucleotidase/UDP-sugar diphosphatase